MAAKRMSGILSLLGLHINLLDLSDSFLPAPQSPFSYPHASLRFVIFPCQPQALRPWRLRQPHPPLLQSLDLAPSKLLITGPVALAIWRSIKSEFKLYSSILTTEPPRILKLMPPKTPVNPKSLKLFKASEIRPLQPYLRPPFKAAAALFKAAGPYLRLLGPYLRLLGPYLRLLGLI